MKKDNPSKPASDLFSKEEKEAMKALARERKKEAKEALTRESGEKDLLTAVKEMDKNSREIGLKLHEIIAKAAPEWSPKTWYGMPAYANADGKVICFFRGAAKFKERYLTLGFQDMAVLDDGIMWPVAYAVTSLNSAAESEIARLVHKAAGH